MPKKSSSEPKSSKTKAKPAAEETPPEPQAEPVIPSFLAGWAAEFARNKEYIEEDQKKKLAELEPPPEDPPMDEPTDEVTDETPVEEETPAEEAPARVHRALEGLHGVSRISLDLS